MLATLKKWARMLKRDIHAIYLVARDTRVPWYAKALAVVVAAYGLSPIDLIPDFIPVLGYLDDLIIIPLGIALVTRLIPADIMSEHRATASLTPTPPRNMTGVALIVATWIVTFAITVWLGCFFWTS